MTSSRPQSFSPRVALLTFLLLSFSAGRAAANSPPEAVPQYATGPAGTLVHPGTVVSPGLVDLLAFVADADGDPLSVTTASVPAGDGTLSLNSDGTAIYGLPPAGGAVQPVVSFSVTDGTAEVGFSLSLAVEGEPPGPPAAPTDLAAFVAEPTPGLLAISVRWADRSFDEAGFRILRRTPPDTAYSVLGEVGVDVTSFADLGAFTLGTTYGYVVESFNSRGSSRSDELLFLAQVEPLLGPDQLQAVTGTAPDGSGSVSLTWNDRDVREYGFQVQRRTGATGPLLLATLGVNAESYADEGVAAGTYTYEVLSFNGTGPLAEVSPAASVTVTVDTTPVVDAQDDPSFIDDPRFQTETGVPLFICEAAFAENDAPQDDTVYSLASVPEPGFPDHGTHGWQFMPSNCPEGTSGTGILYTPDPGFCGTDQFLLRLFFVGTEPVVEDLATVTVRVNQPPTPAFTAECDGLRCALDATASADGCSSIPILVAPGIVSYEWQVDGQAVGSGPTFVHDLTASGAHEVTLTVEDTEGSRRSASLQVTAGLPPTASFTDDCPGGGLVCTLDAGSSSDPDGTIAAYDWDFGDGAQGLGAVVTHPFPDSGSFTVRLTVTDDQGLTDSVERPVIIAPIPPVAAFDSDCSGGLVCAFDAAPSSDLDGDVVAWDWSFGDGGPVATIAQPSHTYAVRGTYTVTLTVTDDDGLQASHGEPVSVSALPVPAFTHDCDGLACTFDASASSDDGAVSLYSWRFDTEGGGSGVTTTHAFAAKGTYEVTLLVEDDDGQSAELALEVEVSEVPVASFVVSCDGMTCAFDASASSDDVGISSYGWDFGDGTGGGGVMVSHDFAEGQDYLVALTVVDGLGQEGSTERWLRQPVAVASVTCDGLVCSFDGSASTDDEPLAGYAWDFGDGNGESGATAGHTYAVKGTYTAVLIVADALGLEDTDAETLAVSENPAASFTYDCDELTCVFDASSSTDDGPIQSYSWRFDDDLGNGNAQVETFTFPTKGDYLVVLAVNDEDGQVSTEQQTVSVSRKPVAAIDSDCDGLTCLFDGSGSTDDGTIVRWEWTFGDGTTYEGPTPPPHVYPVKGTYTIELTVTDDHDQSSSAAHTVSVSKKPTAAFPPPSCAGLVCNFNGSASSDDGAIASYSWSFGDGASANGAAPAHPYPVKGTYTVTLTVTDDMGQTAAKTRSVTVSRKPTASFVYDTCPNQTCTFDGTGSSDDVGITSWTWDFGDGATGNGSTVTHTFAPGVVSSVVKLTVTDELGQTGMHSESVPIQPPDVELPVASGGTWEFYSPTNVGIGRTEQIPITNTGPNDLHLTNRANMVSGFCFQQATTPPAVVAPGQTVTVGVRMQCPSGVLGTKTGTLTVRSDDPDEDPYTLTLRGQMVGGFIPTIRLEASYSPGPGQARQSYVSETAHPRDEVAFYYDPNLGAFEERVGGTCGATDNATFLKVSLESPVAISGCTYQMSWDATPKNCSAPIASTLASGQEVVINTDDFLTDPATCKLERPLASHVRYGEDHHVKITFKYGGGNYIRRVDVRQASRVHYLPIVQDAHVLQVLPNLNLGQDWAIAVSGQSGAKVYTLLKAVPAVAGTYRSAALWLEGYSGPPPAVTVSQLRLTGGWTEDTVTWNNWSSATGGILRNLPGLVAVGMAGRSNVSTAVSANGAYGFLLKTTSTSPYNFLSSEATNGDPYLVLTTTP